MSNTTLLKNEAQTTGDAGEVLVVDDSPQMLSSMGRLLSRRNYTVHQATSGAEAEATLGRCTPDVVVSDIRMPEMDGLELLQLVKARGFDVPVVLITGSPELETAIRAVEHGAFHYLVKPFPPDEFLAVVAKACALRRAPVLQRGPPAGPAADLHRRFAEAMRQLWMAYQPIIGARDGQVFGYEALMRSHEPSLPHPGAILDAALQIDRMPECGMRVRERVAEIFPQLAPDQQIFVNLHPRDLDDDALLAADEPIGRAADKVVLEITEHAPLDKIPGIDGRLEALRERGYRIAIDDLGAGHSNLAAFAQLQPDFVKLDMALVRDLDTIPVKRRLIRSMTEFAHDMDMVVIAEGVETAQERDALVETGVDYLQGYFFARPGPPFPEARW